MSYRVDLEKLLPEILKDDPYGLPAKEIHRILVEEKNFHITYGTVSYNLSIMSKDAMSPVTKGRRGYIRNELFIPENERGCVKTNLLKFEEMKRKLEEAKNRLKLNGTPLSTGEYLEYSVMLINDLIEIIDNE
jgi:hypothetical protein